MRSALLIAGLLCTAIDAGSADSGAALSYTFTSAPKYDASQLGRERFPEGASIVLVTPDGRRPLAPSFQASADPAVSFDGTRILFAAKSAAAHWQIWEAPLAGGTPRQVVRCDADCIHPLYLPDGRVVYTRLSPTGSDLEIAGAAGDPPRRLTFAPGRHISNDVLRDGRILFESDGELFTVYPDGTGVESLRCDHGPRRAGARQLSSGDVIFAVGTRLARFTPALPMQTGLVQPDLEPAAPVAEVSPGKWLISLRKPHGLFALYVWTQDGRRLTPLEVPAGLNAIQPAVIARKVPPRQFPSGLVESRKTANLLCLDARASREPLATPAQAVQVYTRDSAGSSILLGSQKLAGDGSFFVELPADVPLRIDLVDASGHPVRSEHSWFWMRPSEQRICVGCHLGPERAPENKVPEVLLRSTVPEKLLGKTP